MKKKAKEEIVKTLRSHLGEIQWELDINKRDMKKLIERQTVLKRKRVELHKIINKLVPFKKDDTK